MTEVIVVPKVGRLTEKELLVVSKVGLETDVELIVVPNVGSETEAVVEVSAYGTQPGKLKSAPVLPEPPYTMQFFSQAATAFSVADEKHLMFKVRARVAIKA